MQTFLDDVAKKIIASQGEIDQVKIIVPSNRAINFLKEAFKRAIKTPLVAPEIYSVSQFIESLSGVQRLSKVDLLHVFYEVYKEQTPTNELEYFHQFFGWGASLLDEFNEIDAQLVNPKELFGFMKELSKLEAWGVQQKGALSKQHYKIQNQYFIYYRTLYKKLVQMGGGYAGLCLREAVQNLTFYMEQDLPKHFFVGFNALTKAEEAIVQELMAEGKAEIIWDLDHIFYEDANHSAGHFIRTYQKNWNVLKRRAKPQFPKHFSESKEIEIISTAKNGIQAKAAVQIARELNDETPQDSTVVVLGDENLLLPALSVLPEKEMPWNITMGYQLKDTALFGFFKRYFDLHDNLGTSGFPFNELYEFSTNAASKLLFEDTRPRIDKWIRNNMQEFISPEALCAMGDLESQVFAEFDNVDNFIQRLLKIAQTLKNKHLKIKDESFQVQVCDRLLELFESLVERQIEFHFMNSLRDVKMIFESLAGEETFDFTGDPFHGVQIMGLLETRLLDFDNVVITNVNEGILPLGKSSFSWIPFDVRKKFGMNTFVEQDHLYAYHFFRLLQRAKKVFLLYNASAEGLFSGERSRFLIQLEYFKLPTHKLKFNQVALPIPKLNNKQRKIVKTNSILSHLEQIGQEGFSPSSLTQYIRDPYAFYEQRMLKIQPPMDINEFLSPREKGTIMHEVLEQLYQPYLSQTMKELHYDKMLEILPNTLANVFGLAKGKGLKTGKNRLVYQIIEAVIKQFLISEKEQVQQGNQIQIIALEKEFSKSINVKTIGRNINFKGTVDRIDRYNGTLRFVDYKTGSIMSTDLAFYDWEELRTLPKKNALFQVLLYAYLLKTDFNDEDRIAGVIPLKTFKNDFLAIHQKENTRKKHLLQIGNEALSAFENELFELLKEIFDPELPFEEKWD